MTAIINGVMVTGTPYEINQLMIIANSKLITISTSTGVNHGRSI